MNFSQRKGIEPIKKVSQGESIDQVTRIGLWNVLYKVYWQYGEKQYHQRGQGPTVGDNVIVLCTNIWTDFYKKAIDTMGYYSISIYPYLRKYFFECDWNKVYEFIEFIADQEPTDERWGYLTEAMNEVLEEENAAYRFIGGEIAPITNKEEMNTIEEAMSHPLDPVQEHITTALGLFAKKDYRNSMKDSISAVEAICKIITKDANATLGKAINDLKNKGIALPSSLVTAFEKLYGYTSGEGGIRHSLPDDGSSVDQEEARWLLVVCSAFVNYLTIKAEKAGITL